MRILTIAILCLLAACPLMASTQSKKLIEYGWDRPSVEYVSNHVQEMEKIPFDGVVMWVGSKGPEFSNTHSLGMEVFSKRRFRPENYEHAIADLQKARFKRFTDNFIQVLALPGDVDWFDPEWQAVAHNAACLARVAKRGGCKGIMFDPEIYSKNLVWMYPAQKKASSYTFDQYAAKVRQRGREFICAVNKEFPDITILCLFGHSLPFKEASGPPKRTLDLIGYGLLAAFYDGICEAATPRTTIVDGYEWSYGYRTKKAFVEARQVILRHALSISTNPVKVHQHIRAGFGIWADNSNDTLGWHPADFSKNYFTPAGLRASLNYALDLSDEYVWVYSQRFDWWKGTAPKEFVHALRLAKQGPGPGEKNPLRIKQNLKAANMPGYSDQETFADARKVLTDIYDFPKDGWKFRRDASNLGAGQAFYKCDFDDSGWKSISIGQFWEEQGEDYDGRAWYRITFPAPSVEPGRRVGLAFGAVDEAARVWLNDIFIGERDIFGGWNTPFCMEITHTIKPQQMNTLAVQVSDRTGVGGIWKSVKLMVKN